MVTTFDRYTAHRSAATLREKRRQLGVLQAPRLIGWQPLGDRLAEALSGATDVIGDVLTTLGAVQAAIEAAPPSLATFHLSAANAAYHDFHREMDAALVRYAYSPHFLEVLDIEFARRYFAALRRWNDGDDNTPDVWAALFQRAGDERIDYWAAARLGLNAHLNHDLPLALLATWDALGPPGVGEVQPDYGLVVDALADTFPPARGGFSPSWLSEIDRFAGPLDGWTGRILRNATRMAAWDQARQLWPLRDDADDLDQAFSTLDAAASLLAEWALIGDQLADEIGDDREEDRRRPTLGQAAPFDEDYRPEPSRRVPRDEVSTGHPAPGASGAAPRGEHPDALTLRPVPPAQRSRVLVAQAPAQVPAGEPVSVVVRILADDNPFPMSAPLAKLVVDDGGTTVTITVNTTTGLSATGPLQGAMRVLPTGDPDPLLFSFEAVRTGLHRIVVTAWAGGTFLAEIDVEVSVLAGAGHRDAPPRVRRLGDVVARPGEATMEVRTDGADRVFQLRSDTTLFDPVRFAAGSPGTAVDKAIAALQRLARSGSQYSEATTRHWLKAIGVDLWKEMVPAAVRDQFWQIRDDIRAFTIATDHDAVPWEILHPLDADHDEGFLVERVPVLRRTYGQQRSATIGLRDARFVVSQRRPTGAQDEADAIRAVIGGDQGFITSVDQLLAHIADGRCGALHFACHNTFDAAGSRIDMDGGPFVPELLAVAEATRQLAGTSPLVFLNACRTAGATPSFTRTLGWAQRFMAAGAGAFVGTLWDVRTESSAQFATAFYESLASGATLGDATRAARTARRPEMLDPTWLAYTVYGDPFAVATS